MTDKTIHLALSALLATFYVYVIFLIFNPIVSETYRYYYIDKAIKYWPGESDNGFSYVIGDVIDLSIPNIYLSDEGWSHTKEWGGLWVKKGTASLYLDINPHPITDVHLIINADMNQNHSKVHSILHVSMNGTHIGTLNYRDKYYPNNPRDLIIPNELFIKDKINVVSFRTEMPGKLDRFISGHRSRDYYFAIKNITTEPATISATSASH